MTERPTPLPPLQPLRAFEAAVRLASFTRAAEELCLTQGAISRQIRHLEQRLGVTLFIRADRGVHPTAAGAHLAVAVREALAGLARATAEIAVGDEHGPITIGATSAIASLWLMPRLSGFRRQEPALDIRVLASDRDTERTSAEVDLAIEYMRRPPADEHARRLFDEAILPVCSPEYLGDRPPPREPRELLTETLLQLDDDHVDWMGWAEWFSGAGVELGQARRPLRINSYPALLQAAVAGQGVALGWSHLTEDFLNAGSLISLLPDRVDGRGAFWITPTRPVPDGSPVARLRDWLVQVATELPAR